MAFWMDQVSRGWLIYELTDSALQLGLVRGIQAIPILLLSPVAGSTADRFSRKKQILLSQIVDGLMYAGLTFLIFTAAIQALACIHQRLCHGDRSNLSSTGACRDHRRRRADATG